MYKRVYKVQFWLDDSFLGHRYYCENVIGDEDFTEKDAIDEAYKHAVSDDPNNFWIGMPYVIEKVDLIKAYFDNI